MNIGQFIVLVLVVLGLGFLIVESVNKAQRCKEMGGVMTRDGCMKKEFFLDLKQ